MINGFDEQTQPLTKKEATQLLPIFVKCLLPHIGKENRVTSSQMIQGFKAYNIKMDGPRVRKIINHIRTNDLVPGLIATSEGYYRAVTEDEMIRHEESLLEREAAIREVRRSIQRQRKQIFHPDREPQLFTQA